MSFIQFGNRARHQREKMFGMGRPMPLDRNAKCRLMTFARALMRRKKSGKAYGAITAKAYAVLGALLYGFHNAKTGWCYPSYERIAEVAGCARSTAASATKALEAAGLLSWVNRMRRVYEWKIGPLGSLVREVRVIRTSNAYQFNDPKPGMEFVTEPIENTSKSEKRTGTDNQAIFSSNKERRRAAATPPAPTGRPDEAIIEGVIVNLAPVRISPTLAKILGLPYGE